MMITITKILTSGLLLFLLMDMYCLQDDVRQIEKDFNNQLHQIKTKHMFGYLIQNPDPVDLPQDYLILGLEMFSFLFLFVLFCTLFHGALRILLLNIIISII